MNNAADVKRDERSTLAKLLTMMLLADDNITLVTKNKILSMLAREGSDAHELAARLDRGGQLSEAEMQKIFAAGIEQGRAESAATFQSVGEPTWHEIANACAAHPEVFKSESERQFVADMVRRTVCGGVPTEKQANWLRKIYARFT